MAMDFFQSQDLARRKTGWLIFMFFLAVAGIISLLYLLGLIGAGWTGALHEASLTGTAGDLHAALLTGVSGFTALVVGGGSLYKVSQLRGGGVPVAEALGGEPIHPDTRDRHERRLLNIVEEMAIATGIPAPPVYLMREEQGINAFAAGYTTGDAVIGVTQGCIRTLSREQLQGVIAHEFSHILNGDMRINVRLISILHGILIIGLIGYFILRAVRYSSGYGRRDRSNPLPLILGGLGLVVIGSIGTFFGNLIKAAVSRQREFLADASAVQFTRNPDGIAGALKVIGGFEKSSRIQSPAAPEASHMFFGQAIRFSFRKLFATHPPLDLRIRRIDPSWPGGPAAYAHFAATATDSQSPAAPKPAVAALAGDTAAIPAAVPPTSGVEQIGRPGAAHLAYAQKIIAALPAEVVDAAHETFGARGLVYALLMDPEPRYRSRQIAQLARSADAGVNLITRRLITPLQGLDKSSRLPLIDMALPALRRLTPDQYRQFRDNVRALVRADRKIDLFEWSLQKILFHHLGRQFEPRQRAGRAVRRLSRVEGAWQVVLSALAYVGHRDRDAAQRAFAAGAAELSQAAGQILPSDSCGLRALDPALDALADLPLHLRGRLIRACGACVSADRRITVYEAELVRAIAEALDLPMPPLLPGQPLV
ncbi:MAG: M48 family metallopeptidase [Phycisphaerae bacterium]|nr:M48 family metallopeptidase [Phycisphaerae bacterium]